MAVTLVVIILVVVVMVAIAVAVIVIALTMLFLITWCVLVVVPVVLHKVDALIAGVIFSAVLCPMPTMTGWYAQIDWIALIFCALDYSGLTIVSLRLRIAADVKLTIEAGLADANRDSDVGSECRGSDAGSGYCSCD